MRAPARGRGAPGAGRGDGRDGRGADRPLGAGRDRARRSVRSRSARTPPAGRGAVRGGRARRSGPPRRSARFAPPTRPPGIGWRGPSGHASAARERLRAADDRLRAADRADLEARLGRDSLREQLLVELAGLGELGRRRLEAEAGVVPVAVGPGLADAPEAAGAEADDRSAGGATSDGEPAAELDAAAESDETAALEAALDVVVARWAVEPPPSRRPVARPARHASPPLPRARRREPVRGRGVRRAPPAAREPRHAAARPARRRSTRPGG